MISRHSGRVFRWQWSRTLQTTNLVIQIVVGAVTLLGMLGGLMRVLRKMDQLSDMPNTVARLEKKFDRGMDDMKQWQREHLQVEHRRRW